MDIKQVNLRKNGNLQYGNNPNKLILHHPEFNGTVEELNEMMIKMNFTMIGYNFYVRKDGSIWEGRPVDAIGGNCYGQNACSIGIAFEGNFMVDTMGGPQYNSGVELCKYLKGKYSNIKEIGPHKKYWNTACPGDNFPVSQMISAVEQGATPQVTTSVQSNIIKMWDNGDKVKDIQNKLIKLGYNLSADGIFGQNTYNAVEHFQASKGLEIDGIVGDNTLNALNTAITVKTALDIHSYKYLQHEIGASEDNIPGPKTLSLCPLIKRGSTGNIVKWIQTKLGISADGEFGYQTLVAVQKFQSKNRLSPDGVIGQNTWKKLLGL